MAGNPGDHGVVRVAGSGISADVYGGEEDGAQTALSRRRRERPCAPRANGDRRVDGQTTAGAPLPLRPPTPSVRMSGVYSQAGRNCLWQFTAGASRHWKMPAPSCKHGSRAFSNSAPCSFLSLCHILLHRPAAEGHGCVMRRLGMAAGRCRGSEPPQEQTATGVGRRRWIFLKRRIFSYIISFYPMLNRHNFHINVIFPEIVLIFGKFPFIMTAQLQLESYQI